MVNTKRREYNKAHYWANRDQRLAKNREWRLQSFYGLTMEGFDVLWVKQLGLCAICLKGLQRGKTYVDHCHTTRIIRGLLCGKCNLGIGHFYDSVEFLKRATEYLAAAQSLNRD